VGSTLTADCGEFGYCNVTAVRLVFAHAAHYPPVAMMKVALEISVDILRVRSSRVGFVTTFGGLREAVPTVTGFGASDCEFGFHLGKRRHDMEEARGDEHHGP
jgi:hypothetical protein